jgi:thiol-disulfide isomerase/thioredoxin
LFNAYQGRAEAYFNLDRWKEAAADFREALKLQPNNTAAKKRLEDATRELERRALNGDDRTASRQSLEVGDSGLVRDGAFGFPQAQSEVLCDEKELRVSVWNDAEHLYVQAIVWADGDDALGETNDGRPIGDHSNLILDIDANQEATPRVDRTYSLNPWPHLPGLRYSVVVTKNSTTGLQADSKGRGAIKYVTTANGRRVRIDSFAIPLSEIHKTTGETIRLAYYASSPQPKLTLNSAGYLARSPYSPYSLPKKNFHDLKLSDRPALLDPKTVPEGREETVPLPKKAIKPLPKVGAAPPEIAAADWINVDAPLTLAQLRGNVVLVEFWATWCGPCLESIPALNNLHQKYSTNGLRILSFSDQSKQGIGTFLKDRTIKYAIGTGSELAAEYGVEAIPHAFLIGHDGKLLWHGTTSAEDLEQRVIAALASK